MSKEHTRRQKQRGLHRRGIIAAGVLGGAVILVVGKAVWTGQAPQEGKVTVTASGDRLHRVPAGQLPAFAAFESPLVQNAYRYAAAQPDALRIGTTGIVTFRPVIPMERSPSPVTAPRDCCACTSRVT
jgi:hypothetical protein